MDLGAPGADLLGSHEAGALRVLARQGLGVSGRDVARLAGASSSSMRRALLRLERIGLVRSRPSSHAHLYQLQRAHVLWPAVEQVLTAGSRVHRAIADLVTSRMGQQVTVALFGSVARGQADAHSDVDLVLVWAAAVSPAERDALVDDLRELVESMTGNAAQVLAITGAQLGDMVAAGDPLVTSWTADALTLCGPDLRELCHQLARPAHTALGTPLA